MLNENDSKDEVNLENLLQQLKTTSPKNEEKPQISNDIKLNFKQTTSVNGNSVISDEARANVANNLFSNRTSDKEKSIENHLLNFGNTSNINNDANSTGSKMRIVNDLFDSSMNSEIKRNIVDDLFSTNREATVTNKDLMSVTNRYIKPENVIEEGNDEKEIELDNNNKEEKKEKSLNLIDLSNKVEIENSYVPEEKSLHPIDITNVKSINEDKKVDSIKKNSIDIDNEIFNKMEDNKNNESKINKANDTSSNLFSVMIDDNKEKDAIIHISKDINISSQQNKIDELRDKDILQHSLKDESHEEIAIKEENINVPQIEDNTLHFRNYSNRGGPYIQEDSHIIKDKTLEESKENISPIKQPTKIENKEEEFKINDFIVEDNNNKKNESKEESHHEFIKDISNDESIHDKETVKNSLPVMKVSDTKAQNQVRIPTNSDKSLSIIINEEKSSVLSPKEKSSKITVTKSTQENIAKNDDVIAPSYKLPKFKKKNNNKVKNNTDIISNMNLENILNENYKELKPSLTFTTKVNASSLLKSKKKQKSISLEIGADKVANGMKEQFDFSKFVINEISYFDFISSLLSSISFKKSNVTKRRKCIMAPMYCESLLSCEVSHVMKRAKDIGKYINMIMTNYFEVQDTFSNLFDYIPSKTKEEMYNELKKNKIIKYNLDEFNSIFCVNTASVQTSLSSFDISIIDNINGDSFYIAFIISFLSSMISSNNKDKLFAILLDAIRLIQINNDLVFDIAKCITVINIIYDCVMINNDKEALIIIHNAMIYNEEFKSMMIYYLRYVFTMYISIYFGDYYIDVIYEIFNEPNKNLLCIIPEIFDINLNIFYVDEDNEMKMKSFTQNDNTSTNTDFVNVIFFYSSFHILLHSDERGESIETISSFIRVKENKKCTKCKNDQFLLYKNTLLCTECLLSTITQIIKSRVSSLFSDGFASREFALRPISISNSIYIRDIDFLIHYQTSFNNIMLSSLNQMCFQCSHFCDENLIIILSCNCHFDIQCLKDMLISATDGKNVQNVFEQNHQQKLNCLCGDFFNCNEARQRLIAKGITFDSDKERAKQRMIKYAIGYCMICKKCFLSEDDNVDLSVDTNNKKLAYRFKIQMKSSKKKHLVKGIDYIDTEHILCSSCYKRELQRENYIHIINESGDREIHCAVCDKEHIIEEKEFEGKIEKTCCAEKCIIF